MKLQQIGVVIPEDICLQRATEKDWQTVAKMEKNAASELFFPLTDKEEILDYIKNSNVYITHCKDNIVGTVSYEIKKDGAVHFNGLIVLKEYRCRGIAKLVMTQILSELKEKDVFELTVHPKNTPAILLYLKLGFFIKEWKDNYFGDGTPRLVLEKRMSV